MKKTVLSLAILIAFASCEKKTDEKVNTSKTEDSLKINKSDINVEPIPQTCYMEAKGKDSLFLMLADNLGTITGKMHYKNFQKDSSFGDISGFSDGDTLKLDYVFQSEGAVSTREIWFLMKDGKLLEGIGNYDETGEKYKNPIDIKYQGGHVLNPADCKNFEKKFISVAKPVEPAKSESDSKK